MSLGDPFVCFVPAEVARANGGTVIRPRGGSRHESMRHEESHDLVSEGKGEYVLRYIPTGPRDHADAEGYMDVINHENYYVQERSKGVELTDVEKLAVRRHMYQLLAENPHRSVTLRVEHQDRTKAQ